MAKRESDVPLHSPSADEIAQARALLARLTEEMEAEFAQVREQAVATDGIFWPTKLPHLWRAIRRRANVQGWLAVAQERGHTRGSFRQLVAVERSEVTR